MKKAGLLVFLCLSVIVAACGDEESDNIKTAGKDTAKKEPSNEVKKEDMLLTIDEATEIIEENLDTINSRMEEIQSEHQDWYLAEWIRKPERNKEKYKHASDITSERLKDLISANAMKEMVKLNLHQYFASQDMWLAIQSSDMQARIKMVQQSSDSFTVSYLTLASDSGYKSAGTSAIHYVKENETWKYNGIEFINAEERPFNLTYEDLKNVYRDFETGEQLKTEMIDIVTVDGEEYIVLKYENRYDARNVEDSSINYELIEKYRTRNSSTSTVENQSQ